MRCIGNHTFRIVEGFLTLQSLELFADKDSCYLIGKKFFLPYLCFNVFFLQTINAADIATVRKLGKPPYLITLIMDAVILLFRKRIDPIKPDFEKNFLTASWAESLKVLFSRSSDSLVWGRLPLFKFSAPFL